MLPLRTHLPSSVATANVAFLWEPVCDSAGCIGLRLSALHASKPTRLRVRAAPELVLLEVGLSPSVMSVHLDFTVLRRRKRWRKGQRPPVPSGLWGQFPGHRAWCGPLRAAAAEGGGRQVRLCLWARCQGPPVPSLLPAFPCLQLGCAGVWGLACE